MVTSVSIKEQIKKLVELQKSDVDIYAFKRELEDKPARIVELKEKFERDNDPYMYDALIERDFLTRINDIDRSIKVLSQNIITAYYKKLIF